MAYQRRTLYETIQTADDCLEDRLCRQVGITVDQYRALRSLLRTVAIGTIVLTAIYPTMTLPPEGYVALGALALGPDVAEAWLTRE